MARLGFRNIRKLAVCHWLFELQRGEPLQEVAGVGQCPLPLEQLVSGGEGGGAGGWVTPEVSGGAKNQACGMTGLRVGGP
jgi:hypothetical protein